MKLHIFNKLISVIILSCLFKSQLASEITLIYEPADSTKTISKTFNLRPGERLTHELVSTLLKIYFNFSEQDLDNTMLGLIYEDDPSSDIFVDLEYEGPIAEFATLVDEGADLTLSVFKDLSEDMSDDESTYEPAFVQIIYDSPLKKCEYTYDANKYGQLTYSRLAQILADHCGISRADLKYCHAGIKKDRDLIPIEDMTAAENFMKLVPVMAKQSTIIVFDWKH